MQFTSKLHLFIYKGQDNLLFQNHDMQVQSSKPTQYYILKEVDVSINPFKAVHLIQVNSHDVFIFTNKIMQ